MLKFIPHLYHTEILRTPISYSHVHNSGLIGVRNRALSETDVNDIKTQIGISTPPSSLHSELSSAFPTEQTPTEQQNITINNTQENTSSSTIPNNLSYHTPTNTTNNTTNNNANINMPKSKPIEIPSKKKNKNKSNMYNNSN